MFSNISLPALPVLMPSCLCPLSWEVSSWMREDRERGDLQTYWGHLLGEGQALAKMGSEGTERDKGSGREC